MENNAIEATSYMMHAREFHCHGGANAVTVLHVAYHGRRCVFFPADMGATYLQFLNSTLNIITHAGLPFQQQRFCYQQGPCMCHLTKNLTIKLSCLNKILKCF